MLSNLLKRNFSAQFNLSRLKSLRQSLHNSPEVGFKEYNTGKIIQKYFTETLGISSEQFQKIGGETGFIITMQGQSPKQKLKGPKTIMFRTDIDALHIGGGKAKHLCGHDGHMTSITAFAELLISEGMLKKIPQNCSIKLLFQPAEEATRVNGVYAGGAQKVVEEGGMKGVDEIYGFFQLSYLQLTGYHNWPCRPFGKCLIQPGNFLPAVSIIDFEIIGKGGHGSVPEKCLDPIEPMADIIIKQRELKRKFALENPNFRWSLGIVSAGTAHNIIPDKAILEGSLRVFDQELSLRIKKEFDNAALEICKKHKCQLKGEVIPLYPAVFNHDLQTEVMRKASKKIFGENNVGEEVQFQFIQFYYQNELNVIGEDFAFYLQQVPGAFGLMSSGTNEPGFTHLHQAQFKFNDDLIEPVAQIYMEIAKQRLIEDN